LPFSDQELHEKFLECGELVLSSEALHAAVKCLGTLETVTHLSELVQLLSAPTPRDFELTSRLEV